MTTNDKQGRIIEASASIVAITLMATLTFLGAARTVTGSKYLLEVDGRRILVDCGQFQGLKELRRRNWAAFPVNPDQIDAVILTHAHIDHSGLLPRLTAGGYRGPVFCTAGTAALCGVVLPDAGHLQEEDARYANQRGFSRHAPALPLFTEADAHQTLRLLRTVPFNQTVEVVPGIHAEFTVAGHLLGSSYVRISRSNGGGARILFGGDLGRYGRPVLPDPAPAPEAETYLVESTYGDRVHPTLDDAAHLKRITMETLGRGGKLIIPSFAIGRVEEVLYWFKRLEDEKQLPAVPLYVDSPMALEVLEFYRQHEAELDEDVRTHGREVCAYCTKRFHPVATARESRAVTASREPSIVISASGMATGGRVLHHLAACLPDERNTVLFVGYQAAGTRGRQLIDGAKTVKIHGAMIPVHASIQKLDSMSAHADSDEILRWLQTAPKPPQTTYLVHGEGAAQDELRARIESTLGWNVHIPEHGQKVELPL